MNRLKEIRKSMSLTLRDLAAEVNINSATLNQIENEIRPFTQEHLEILTKYFDCSADYLLGNSDIRKPETHTHKMVVADADGTVTPIQVELLHNTEELDVEDLMKVFEYIDFLKSKKIGGNKK